MRTPAPRGGPATTALAGLAGLLGIALVAGCQDAPTAPPAAESVADETPTVPPSVRFASAADVDAVAAAVDDAVTRVLPSLDGAAGPTLRSDLDAIAGALEARDATKLAIAARQAAAALVSARHGGTGDAHLLLHLDLIGLVLDRAAALVVAVDPPAAGTLSTESTTN
jgi:hypothetical protein